MATTASRIILHILNSVYLIIGLAVAVASMWFFYHVTEFTSLRNSNHYLLDYNVYWPQAIPWVFFFVSIFVIGVSICGFAGTRKKSRGLLSVYMTMLSIAALLLIAAAVVALVFADNKSTDDFVKDTVWDSYFQGKTDTVVADAFGWIEKKYHCCGAEGPRDYKNWKNEFPMSCCDTFYHGWYDPYTIDCDFTNKLANERHGCSTVAAQYARIAIKVLSGASIFTAFLAIFGVAAAITLKRALEKRSRPPVHNETESKKGLI